MGDMDGIYEYIAFNFQSPENAMGQYNRIADLVLELGFFPEKFRLVDFESERSQRLRRKTTGARINSGLPFFTFTFRLSK